MTFPTVECWLYKTKVQVWGISRGKILSVSNINCTVLLQVWECHHCQPDHRTEKKESPYIFKDFGHVIVYSSILLCYDWFLLLLQHNVYFYVFKYICRVYSSHSVWRTLEREVVWIIISINKLSINFILEIYVVYVLSLFFMCHKNTNKMTNVYLYGQLVLLLSMMLGYYY